jgi:hypothetical protein
VGRTRRGDPRIFTTAVPRALFSPFPVYDLGAWRPRGIAACLSRHASRGMDTIMAPVVDAAGQVEKLVARI